MHVSSVSVSRNNVSDTVGSPITGDTTHSSARPSLTGPIVTGDSFEFAHSDPVCTFKEKEGDTVAQPGTAGELHRGRGPAEMESGEMMLWQSSKLGLAS